MNRRAIGAIRRQVDRANLPAARERDLLKTLWSSPDECQRQAARTELWESHSKLVVAIARRHRHARVEFVDLVSAGHLGLHAAISRFNPDTYSTRLSTYAIPWIRWYIQDYLQRNWGPVRLPGSSGHRHLLRMGNRLWAEARQSCERERVEPTDGEVCERIGRRIGLSGDEVANSLRALGGGCISLDTAAGDGAAAPSLIETLVDGNAASEDDVIRRLDRAKARVRIIRLAREILTERERMVFLARCMNAGEEAVHLSTLATALAVSPERVYQLEASARRKIGTALAREGYAGVIRDGRPILLPTARAPRRQRPPSTAALATDLIAS